MHVIGVSQTAPRSARSTCGRGGDLGPLLGVELRDRAARVAQVEQVRGEREKALQRHEEADRVARDEEHELDAPRPQVLLADLGAV